MASVTVKSEFTVTIGGRVVQGKSEQSLTLATGAVLFDQTGFIATGDGNEITITDEEQPSIIFIHAIKQDLWYRLGYGGIGVGPAFRIPAGASAVICSGDIKAADSTFWSGLNDDKIDYIEIFNDSGSQGQYRVLGLA